MTVRYEALIEHWPAESLLFVRVLPGLQVSGRDAQELRQRTATALRSHLEWMVWRELLERPDGEIDLSVSEQAKALTATVGPRFAADLPAPGEDEIELALAVGRATLSELIDAREAETIDEHALRHVARLDRWYASRITGDPPDSALVDTIDDLVDAAGAFEEAVDAFADRGLPELFERDGEEWTLAKILRRRTGHLREHAPLVTPPIDSLDEDDEFDDDDAEL